MSSSHAWQAGTSLMGATAVVNRPTCQITINGAVPSSGSMTFTAGADAPLAPQACALPLLENNYAAQLGSHTIHPHLRRAFGFGRRVVHCCADRAERHANASRVNRWNMVRWVWINLGSLLKRRPVGVSGNQFIQLFRTLRDVMLSGMPTCATLVCSTAQAAPSTTT
jgi:hypothetical protein